MYLRTSHENPFHWFFSPHFSVAKNLLRDENLVSEIKLLKNTPTRLWLQFFHPFIKRNSVYRHGFTLCWSVLTWNQDYAQRWKLITLEHSLFFISLFRNQIRLKQLNYLFCTIFVCFEKYVISPVWNAEACHPLIGILSSLNSNSSYFCPITKIYLKILVDVIFFRYPRSMVAWSVQEM